MHIPTLTVAHVNVSLSLSADAVKKAVEAANTETGGSGIELGGIYVTVEASWLEMFL